MEAIAEALGLEKRKTKVVSHDALRQVGSPLPFFREDRLLG
jgi:hypothetical protein